ncbi:AMP-binding protein [Siccirubricoccus sp. KC 17139]|uniref:AMP-binding protein n=1 Tax=Siccirubricoccus soli TaxID=2899147 RepID=A0ABT1D588_9PROT|nr:fatty acyl-CoA synthetase [Siccirubricoccus soli]MCO6417084.1 AMP-binding protein [Siccirubricoccus soli]MCP2683219.1 fatty acyl-CoA synthetase [Siccirubricoccus soli]
MQEIGGRVRRNTIGDAVRRAGARFRDRPALRFGERNWSFAALDQAADRVARFLLAEGLQPGDRVCAFGRNSDAYLLLWLGCARAGLVHVPANFALTATELDYILRQSGASALFTQPALETIAGAAGGELLRGTLDVGQRARDILAIALDAGWDVGPPPGEQVSEEDLVQLQYTSGTTGLPKGAMMTHRALLAEYASCIVELEMLRHDRCLAALPLYHTAQMHAFTMPALLNGGFTLLIEAPQPALVLELIERERITTFFAPPTVWISLLQHPDFARRDLSSLQKVQYGASIMPVPVLQELRRRLPGARPFNCYGQSEIAPLATVLRPEEHEARPGSVGRPVLNVETRVVDAEMRDVAPGERGEVVHRSPQLLLGYWNMPEETAKAFEGGWFHSGDVATIDVEGYLSIVDRTKDLINTGGVLVASREVEEALFTHPAVAEVAVIAVPDPKWIEAVAAVVVLRADAPAEVEVALLAHARERLAPYKVPKRIIIAESLPKNTAGKLLKRELRQIYAGTASGALGAG